MDLAIVMERVAGWQRRFKQTPQPAASDDAIADLRARATSALEHDVPDDYVAALRIADGIDWNGFVLYASARSAIAGREGKRPRYIEGIVEQNRAWREGPSLHDAIVLGESGDALFVMRVGGGFETRDRVANDVIATHGSFAEMLDAALAKVAPPQS